MRALLVDVCIEAQARIIEAALQASEWQELWLALRLGFLTLREVGLNVRTTDLDVWHFCQREQMALLTTDRNDESATSLTTTLRTHNTPDSLPVFTLANAQTINHSRHYAERCADKLLLYLYDIDNLRGTGRLWLP